MRRRAFTTALTALALRSLTAGCAGVGVGASTSGAVSPAQDLVGSWHGAFWLLGGSYSVGDGTCLLRIERDGTFTVSVTPTAAANNLAKPGRWSGTGPREGGWSSSREGGGHLSCAPVTRCTASPTTPRPERTSRSPSVASGAPPGREAERDSRFDLPTGPCGRDHRSAGRRRLDSHRGPAVSGGPALRAAAPPMLFRERPARAAAPTGCGSRG